MNIEPASSHAPLYPARLAPDDEQTFTHQGAEYRLPVRHLRLKRWVGEPIANTFGGKPLIDVEGAAQFAELAIRRMAIADGWTACWVETYASGRLPYFFEEWESAGLRNERVNPPAENQLTTLARIAEANGGSYTGCWDVLAWCEERTVFFELKRSKRDRIRATQLRWVQATLEVGLALEQFVIVEWDYDEAGVDNVD